MREIDIKMAELNKKFKAQIINQGTDIIEVEKIPFSSPTANWMTYGGIPVGKITELYGGEGGGKTTTALDIVANTQKLYLNKYNKKVQELNDEIEQLEQKTGKEPLAKAKKLRGELDKIEEQGPKVVVYVDAEQTLDTRWAQLLGVDTDAMILVRPQAESAEEILQIIIELVDTGNVALVVLDSLPMLVSKNIIDETLDKKSYGGISQVLSVFCSKVTPYLNTHQCAFIGINQVREDLASMYNTESTPGGRMWKHACSFRIRCKKDTFLDANNNELPSRAENPAGNKVSLEIKKAKGCRSDRRLGYYTLNYTTGIDVVADMITTLIQYNLVNKRGAWYYLLDEEGNETEGFQGMAKFKAYLQENEEVRHEYLNKLEDMMKNE